MSGTHVRSAVDGVQSERPPVMADVARLAGVSLQTVSRVINHQSNIRPATRERVEHAIRQLDYRPNVAARALVNRRSGTIGVVGAANGFWGPSTVHRAIRAAGRASGYVVNSVDLPTMKQGDLRDAVDYLRDQRVEGIILIAANDDALEVVGARGGGDVPIVVVEGDASRTRWTVGVDQVAGAETATRHLIQLGHRNIAHVAGPLDWTESRGRLQGWQNALDAAGLPAVELVQGDWSAASGYAAGLALARSSHISAVFVANDHMAIGTVRALVEAGRSVPGDVSVVGFDDIPEAAYLVTPLTTVRQNFTAVGHHAIGMLRAAMHEGAAPDDSPTRLVKPELVVRASTSASEGRTR